MSSSPTATGARRVEVKPSNLEVALASVWRHTQCLVAAINSQRYEAAWLEALELQRALRLVDFLLEKRADGEHASVAPSLDVARTVAQRALARAPVPSDAAIQQARSTNWWGARPAWDAEERAWQSACIALGPLTLDGVSEMLALEHWSKR